MVNGELLKRPHHMGGMNGDKIGGIARRGLNITHKTNKQLDRQTAA